MSFSSKRILLGMGVGLVMLAAYFMRALGPAAPAPDDIRAWATLMLIFIGISIVVMIVVQILFHILYSIGIAIKERRQSDEKVERIISATVAEDERDKHINLMAVRVGSRVFGMGVLLALVCLAAGASMLVALHLILAACFLGSFAEGIASVIYYEKGI